MIADASEDLLRGAKEHQATGTHSEGLVSRESDGLRGLIGETQRVEREVVGDRVRDGSSRVEADVRGRRRRQQGACVGRGVGVSREARGAHRTDAVDGRVGGEVMRARVRRAHDGPAAEDAVGQGGRSGGRDAIDGTERDAVGQFRGEVDDAARGADEVTDVEGDEAIGHAALDGDELGATGEEIDGTEGLAADGLLASAELEEPAAEIDGRGVGDPVQAAEAAVLVVEVEQRGIDVQGAGARERGIAVHHDGTAVEGGRAGVRAVAVEVERILARAGQADIAGRTGRKLAGVVVRVDQDVSSTASAGDVRTLVRHDGLGEGPAEELREAIEVERAADRREVVVGLEGVVTAELDCPLVKHEQAAHRVGPDGLQPGDCRTGRIDRQRAFPGLDERRAAAADAVAAGKGGGNRQVTKSPDVEGGGAGGHLIDDATGDGGDTARADEDTAGTEAELDAVAERQAGVPFDGEGITLGVESDDSAGIRGEQDVRVRDDALGGATEGGRVGLVFGRIEPAHVIGAEGGEGEIRGVSTRVVLVHNRPRHDATVSGAVTTALAREGGVSGETDLREGGRRESADAAEQQRSPGSGRRLVRCVVAPSCAAEPERGGIEELVLQLDADHAEALAESDVVEVLGGGCG